MTTFAPSRANLSATAFPIPRPAPVTIADRPESLPPSGDPKLMSNVFLSGHHFDAFARHDDIVFQPVLLRRFLERKVPVEGDKRLHRERHVLPQLQRTFVTESRMLVDVQTDAVAYGAQSVLQAPFAE